MGGTVSWESIDGCFLKCRTYSLYRGTICDIFMSDIYKTCKYKHIVNFPKKYLAQKGLLQKNKHTMQEKNQYILRAALYCMCPNKRIKERPLFLLFREFLLLKARGWLNYSSLLEGILRRFCFSRPAARWIMKVACEIFMLYHWKN